MRYLYFPTNFGRKMHPLRKFATFKTNAWCNWLPNSIRFILNQTNCSNWRHHREACPSPRVHQASYFLCHKLKFYKWNRHRMRVQILMFVYTIYYPCNYNVYTIYYPCNDNVYTIYYPCNDNLCTLSIIPVMIMYVHYLLSL